VKRAIGHAFGIRGAALAVMTLVTAWSLWAWAQNANPGSLPHDHMHMHGAASGQAAASGAPSQRPAHVHAPALATSAHPAAAEESSPAEEPESETPGPINWTDFGTKNPPFMAMIINFAILAAGYYYLGKKGIADGLKNRRDAISREIDEAQAMKHEAEARAKTYQAKLATLEVEAREARDSLVRAGEAERERIVKEADAKAERMRKDAEFMVEQEMKQIRIDLWREAVETAVAAAETLLKERVTGEDQQRLAEGYLQGFGKPAGGSSGVAS
jgi:F0F1-type ATP synthase membrane subunit b/b'